ncbi:MAG TPA: GntR family transcriptional regulator, partial [Roseiarcus sp.]|nr:GntR family transcriptional regulator [Roseiarcus sp.]
MGARDKDADFAYGGLAHKRNANDSLASVLGREIIVGLHPPGSRLPTEASLLVRFGVSRPTLREAFRALEAKGLIVSRQRVGTLV